MKRIIVTRKAYLEMVRSCLDAAWDQTREGLPPFCSYKDRARVLGVSDGGDVTRFGSYENGVLEGIGMALGIINVRFGLKGFKPECNEGIGIIDALEACDGFYSKMQEIWRICWSDKGGSVEKAVDAVCERTGGSWNDKDIYPYLPDTEAGAKAFLKVIEETEKLQVTAKTPKPNL